jgi:hypothetical protein
MEAPPQTLDNKMKYKTSNWKWRSKTISIHVSQDLLQLIDEFSKLLGTRSVHNQLCVLFSPPPPFPPSPLPYSSSACSSSTSSSVLEIQARALHILIKGYTTELQPSPANQLFFYITSEQSEK